MVNATPANLPEAITQAKAENKFLLLEFGSSDSCPPCMALEEQVFSKPEFSEYARSNLVFLRIDFPDRHKLPEDVTATNALLGVQFDIKGFPTFIALNHEGREAWRTEGVTKSQIDLKSFVGLIESVRSQQR